MWAGGLLASTREITTFGTLHVAFVNPTFAAKQMVTADHIGHGRFGLNIVSGWNPIEFGMMGVALGDHDGRYDYAEEWIEIVKRIWSEDEPFDYDGKYYKLKAVLGKPKPWWGTRPILVSAGNSETGREFAAHNADCLFTTVPPKHEDLQEKLKFFRDAAPPGQLRNIFASCHLMIRRTRKEAEDYHHYIVYEQGDWESAEYAFKLRGSRINSWLKADEEKLKARLISGAGLPDRRQLRRCGGDHAAPEQRRPRRLRARHDQLRQRFSAYPGRAVAAHGARGPARAAAPRRRHRGRITIRQGEKRNEDRRGARRRMGSAEEGQGLEIRARREPGNRGLDRQHPDRGRHGRVRLRLHDESLRRAA